jgi:starvation-inducible DNA-binding protein
MNETLVTAKICLANTFLMYFKSQAYHWNVEGMFFSQYHDFFGKIYEEVYGAVDPLAEEIRAMGEYAPKNIEEFYKVTTINNDNSATNVTEMLQDLQEANNKTIESLNKLFDLLTKNKEQGFADFIAGRLDAHKKHGWMIRSSLKKVGE